MVWVGADENDFFGASRRGKLRIIQELIKKVDVNARQRGGTTALMFAAQEGHLNVVKFLVDNGAQLNAKDLANRTALIFAVEKGHANVVQYLVDMGADISIKDNSGRTALDAAVNSEDKNIITILNG